jgi:hypothetical protein
VLRLTLLPCLHPIQLPFSLPTCLFSFCACLLQVAPHILIHWRPDDSQYKAFLTRKAPVGAKVDTNAALEMSVLPSVKGLGDNIKPFTVWHTTKQDDSDLMSFLCGPVVSCMPTAWSAPFHTALPDTDSGCASCCDHTLLCLMMVIRMACTGSKKTLLSSRLGVCCCSSPPATCGAVLCRKSSLFGGACALIGCSWLCAIAVMLN